MLESDVMFAVASARQGLQEKCQYEELQVSTHGTEQRTASKKYQGIITNTEQVVKVSRYNNEHRTGSICIHL